MSASTLPVALAAVSWDFPLVGRTRMLSEAWTRAGRRNLFVELPSLRPTVAALRHPFRRREHEPHVLRTLPLAPPRLWSRLPAAWLERAARLSARALRRRLERELAFDWSAATALVVTPAWAPWLAELPFGRVVYDCIDELAVHVPKPELAPLFARWEGELVDRADGALVTASALGERLARRRPELPIALVPNGVDDRWFQERAAACPAPADLDGLPRPCVGFVGALYHWIDWKLIDAVARALPSVGFVFVGPCEDRAAAAELARRPNVRFLGARPYELVPAYIAAFDLCWVPFRDDAIGRAANPVKIYEYLALGKPVVSTPVADVDAFEGLVELVRDPLEAVRCIERALSAPRQDAERRRDFAHRSSWSARAEEVLRFVEGLPRRVAVAARAGAE